MQHLVQFENRRAHVSVSMEDVVVQPSVIPESTLPVQIELLQGASKIIKQNGGSTLHVGVEGAGWILATLFAINNVASVAVTVRRAKKEKHVCWCTAFDFAVMLTAEVSSRHIIIHAILGPPGILGKEASLAELLTSRRKIIKPACLRGIVRARHRRGWLRCHCV